MNANKNNYTCKTCIYQKYWCLTDDNGTCDEWEGPDSEPELTELITKGLDRFSVYLIILDVVIFITAYMILRNY